MLKRPKFAEAGMVIAAWGVPLAPAITFLVLDLFSGRELWYAQNQHEQTELNIFSSIGAALPTRRSVWHFTRSGSRHSFSLLLLKCSLHFLSTG
jgi:hypothetical protein